MSQNAEHLRQTLQRTQDLGAVVHTMKALAASKVGQFEDSVRALEAYYHTLTLGLTVCLRNTPLTPSFSHFSQNQGSGAIVFGSDQGLVGQFNEVLTDFVTKKLADLPGPHRVWVVGERIHSLLLEKGIPVESLWAVPTSVRAITPLVGNLLLECQAPHLNIFHNRPKTGIIYEQSIHRLLPLDEEWIREIKKTTWITKRIPETLGNQANTLSALIREYLFVSLFKACAESQAAENTSRLASMQRAEKNINERLEELRQTYNRVRQTSIDEELFDIVSGYEALERKAADEDER